jgi:molybdenum cofactor synthesis domain-containing protein
MPRTAGIIIIGNEILSGRIQDSNSSYLARELRDLGVKVLRISVIPDNTEDIALEISAFSKAYDYVFTTGGVGPTHDDVTMEGVAEAFGLRTARHPRLAEIIRRRCGPEAGESSLKMADLPEGAEIIEVDGLRFPPVVVRNVYVFPGIPGYLRDKFSAIKERFRSKPFHLRKIYVTEEECFLIGSLDTVVKEFKDVTVGSYPVVDEPDYKVVVTLECTDPVLLDEARSRFLSLIPADAVVRSE